MSEQSQWRFLMPIVGGAFLIAAGVGLTGFFKLVASVSQGAGAGPGLWLDYVLIGVALAALAFAGCSILVSWLRGRRHNVVPGPALYLLGLAMAILGGEAAILGDMPVGLALLLAGLAIIWAEYRSDWL